MLDVGPVRDGQYFTVMRTDAHKAQSLQRMREPFQMHGTIISADAERVTQSIGRGESFTYKTKIYCTRLRIGTACFANWKTPQRTTNSPASR